MSEKMCQICKKELKKKDVAEFLEMVKGADFFCKKCGRVANEKSRLCKPVKISKKLSD